ncbi:uncharacterized protein BKCO1_2200074 [Diplodia corticola]|uniref:Uncharacterized protein n=1 Tax=Diplodia corticola TaxID=236234 RepID=A0A1J9R2R4_9PEZI|nr:uncharacterized protein BKCO1_2200074 [Diplodia corticola]OJD34530.1 hypothetical protein BKCO1_2200074 [Diplodia corticola]
MDQATNSPARCREFDAKLERISDQSKCGEMAKAGFVGDGHVHFKGETPGPSKDAAPVEASHMAQSGSGKVGGLPG